MSIPVSKTRDIKFAFSFVFAAVPAYGITKVISKVKLGAGSKRRCGPDPKFDCDVDLISVVVTGARAEVVTLMVDVVIRACLAAVVVAEVVEVVTAEGFAGRAVVVTGFKNTALLVVYANVLDTKLVEEVLDLLSEVSALLPFSLLVVLPVLVSDVIVPEVVPVMLEV